MDHSVVIESVLAEYAGQRGALLPLLHALQDTLGFVPPEAVPRLAKALDLSRAEVEGVISYYRHFRRAPPPRQVLCLCRAEACQAVGGEALFKAAKEKLEGCADVALEEVYCLGLCACGPALQVGETRQHGRMTLEKLDRLIADLVASGSKDA